MLVLSRKAGEAIVIGGGITVYVVDVKGKFVRLGFTAPSETKILRSELVPLNFKINYDGGKNDDGGN
jgi:carbon storage regulator